VFYKFYLIFSPQEYDFTLLAFRENLNLDTRVPQILKSRKLESDNDRQKGPETN
jgi:hypothetical protein